MVAKNSTSFNRLGDENSSYLLQHKDNPVHWWSYGPDAIQNAKDENKPIFLSIGYSSCHWCHVMGNESFQDQATADYLNEHFVCIKVDREEYPDLDHYYQQACQLFIQTGGWPLSAFLLPDMRPFFVGTYYPHQKKEEGATFMELLVELRRAFHEDTDKIEENAAKATETLKNGIVPNEPVEFPNHFPAPMAIMDAIKEFSDDKNGGYGVAPKFPHYSFYEWAIEQMLEGMIDQEFGQHIITTLENFLMGGVCDHVRGGVHRYSVDDQFLIPHFEKMLYDQAGFLRLLSKLSLIYPSPIVYDSILNTLDYLKTEMLSEKGYLFSAQDADSEGHEGLYFTYTEEEFEGLLNKASDDKDDLTAQKEKIKKWFQITKKGNFSNGLNVISLNTELKEGIFTSDSWEVIRRVRAALLEDRKNRLPPATDNKGVASWNFHLVCSLIDVMQYCRIDVIRQSASELFNQVVEGMYKNFTSSHEQDEQHNQKEVKETSTAMVLRHSTTLETSLPYLEDYVFFAEAQLRLYEISANHVFKENFRGILDFILKEFIDDQGAILTRAVSSNDHQLYPNEEANNFDSSFKSAAANLIQITRRARILFKEADLGENIDKAHEKLKNQALRNPLSAGEALRASTYPMEAYRVVKIPGKWLENSDFLNFFNYFLPRFVLDYHEGDQDENETWQICNLNQCEMQGNGLEEFMKALRPPKEKQDQ